MGSQGGFGKSKEFLDLIKSIGESRSKAEEDRIVLREIESLKAKLGDPNTSKFKLKEYIIRLVYVEMLGHDASFGYIHAVKMTHDENLHLKRTGYLAVTLFLNEEHDLIILIVNTIQKDLKSDNYLVVCAALNAVCRLINEETIPAVLPQVVELLEHQKEAVRKKAVMALQRFHRRAPGSVSHLIANFRKRLCDNDPGVMGATLCPLFDLIMADVDSFKDMVVSLVNILKQVTEHRLPKNYDYHQMPAPFIQIKLLKILAVLGSGDKKASEQIYTILGDIMRKCDSTSNIGNAILYECICCVSSLHPNPKLLEAAADGISKFLRRDSHNLMYLGVDALSRLIKISPEIAEQHQLAVIDCLEDPDDTLKRKTFELLYKMTKSSNVEVIVDRMIDYMININDSHYKTEIASRCVEVAEHYAPSNQWFIQTMNKVFEHAGDLVNSKVAHSLMRLIAEGFGEDDAAADSQLRSSAVESYLQIMVDPKLPSTFIQVICWVLGEYGTADGKHSATYITGKLCDVAEAHAVDDTVKAYAVTALMKIYSFEIAAGRKVDILPEIEIFPSDSSSTILENMLGYRLMAYCLPQCQSLIEEMLASSSTDLQQRACELQDITGLDAQAVKNIMPKDSACEDFEIDKNLSFLDDYIQRALENGAQPYITESGSLGISDVTHFTSQENHESSIHALRFEAYERPTPAVSINVSPALDSSTEVPVPELSYLADIQQPIPPIPSASNLGSSELKLRLDGVQKKWGRPTYSSPVPSTSSTDIIKNQNKANQPIAVGSSNAKESTVSYDSRKQVPEISPEKQKLAASLFGGASKSDGKQSSSSAKVSKPLHHPAEKSASVTTFDTTIVKPSQPPPDLLDLGEPSFTSTAPSVDPFKQLEGLLDLMPEKPASNAFRASTTDAPDLTSLFTDMSLNVQGDSLVNPISNMIDKNGLGGNTGAPSTPQTNKGPNLKAALEKDAFVRHMGVMPSGQDPNLFKDLLS